MTPSLGLMILSSNVALDSGIHFILDLLFYLSSKFIGYAELLRSQIGELYQIALFSFGSIRKCNLANFKRLLPTKSI